MLDEDAILNSPVVYSEAEVLTRFQQSCEAEAEEPGQHTERLTRPQDAGPIVKVNAAHTAAVKRCKVAPFRLYDCRHTFATRATMDGVDLVTLAAILGHSRIQMVLRYAHPGEEHHIAAMGKMQRYMVK